MKTNYENYNSVINTIFFTHENLKNMKYVTPTTMILFLILISNFTFAQQNCDPQALCENAIDLIFDTDYERIVECDTLPDTKEGLSLKINSCNSNVVKNSVYFESHCITPNLQVVWYKFNTGDHEYTNIKVMKGGTNPIKSFGIDVFESCQNSSILDNCDFVGIMDNSADLQELKLKKFTDYYIAVGSKLQDTGAYEILVDVYNAEEVEYCGVNKVTITADKQPPYQIGDVVTFSIYIPEFTDPFSNWGQGIVPVFGTGWDLSSFEHIEGAPVNSVSPNENWQWWNAREVSVNMDILGYKTYIDEFGRRAICLESNCPDFDSECLLTDELLPGGWFAYQDGGTPDCIPGSGHPNHGWGDGGGPWELSFSLIVGDPNTLSIFGEVDLGVEIYVFSDLQIGCWPPLPVSCKSHQPGELKAYNINCNNPPISAGEDIIVECGEELFEIIGDGPEESNFIQYWGTVDGEIIGSNDSYNVQINGTGNYRLFLEDTLTGCVTYDDVEIVYNTTELNLTVDNIACFGESSGSARVNSVGLIEWSTGGTGFIVSNLSAGNYSVTVTEGDCVRTIDFEVTEPETELTITSEEEISVDNAIITIDVEGGIGEYEIVWFYDGIPIATDVTELTVFEEGTYIISVKDENNCIQTITVNIVFTTSVITIGGGESISAYPNPVNNTLFLEGESVSEISNFEIISVSGQTVKVGRDGIQSGQIDVAHLSPGQYILRIIMVDGNQGILKFIKD